MTKANTLLDSVVNNLTLDSRRVKPGDLFFALPGKNQDGRQFIEDAAEKGAALIIADIDKEQSDDYFLKYKNIKNLLPFVNLKDAIGFIAANFYDHPSRHCSVIGITGTNGKTSCSHFIAQILEHSQQPSAIIGTLGAGPIDQLKPLENTTPHAILVQQLLRKFCSLGTKTIAMEVTSVALEQKRVAGVQFNTIIFTNFSRDHLDYHSTLEAYWLAKKKLFSDFSWQNAVINLEDEKGVQLINEILSKEDLSQLSQHHTLIGYTTESMEEVDQKYSFKKPLQFITTEKVSYDENGIRAIIKTPWGEGEIQCPLFGRFNLSNILACLASVCLQGIAFDKVILAIKQLKTVPGRMLTLQRSEKSPAVIIDYAHTPDALTQVLKAVREHCRGKVWCVFGCGGDRDKGKRPLMAAVAEQYSDQIIITPDNPRSEDIHQIFADMLQGLKKPDGALVEQDRKKAIQKAIESADSLDVVVIAGKGHETIQIIKEKSIPFNDEKVALEIIQSLQGKI